MKKVKINVKPCHIEVLLFFFHINDNYLNEESGVAGLCQARA